MDYTISSVQLAQDIGTLRYRPAEEIFSALRSKHPGLDWCAFLSFLSKAEKDGVIKKFERDGKNYYLKV